MTSSLVAFIELADGEPEPPTGHSSIMENTIAYAALGLEVMPRRQGRRGTLIDALSGSPRAGLIGVDQVRAYWRRHPRTPAVALVTGWRSGVFGIDIDVGHVDSADGFASWATLEERHGKVAEGPSVRTPRGGRHLYFLYPTDRRLPACRAIASGVEVIGETGALNLPPSSKRGAPYVWERAFDEIAPPPAPLWLLQLACPLAEPHQRQRQLGSAARSSERYTAAAIRGEYEAVATAPLGSRNAQLNRSTFSLARFVLEGKVSAQEIHEAMEAAALEAGLERGEIKSTIASAMRRSHG